MPLPRKIGTGRVLLVAGDPLLRYTNKVMALGPIAYWPMAEPSGAVSLDASGNGRGGAYTGVTLGNAGAGDGRTSAGFDGSTSFNNVHSASFASAFNGVAGTVSAWVRVASAGVWTDAVFRRWLSFITNSNSNGIQFRKESTNNTLYFEYRAGTTTNSVSAVGTQTSTGWIHMLATWDKNAGGSGEMKAYIGGVQLGSTQTSLGTFGGTMAATTTCIGALNTTPSQASNGFIAHVAVYNYAVSAAQAASLASVA